MGGGGWGALGRWGGGALGRWGAWGVGARLPQGLQIPWRLGIVTISACSATLRFFGGKILEKRNLRVTPSHGRTLPNLPEKNCFFFFLCSKVKKRRQGKYNVGE